MSETARGNRRHRVAVRIGTSVAAMLLPLAIVAVGGGIALHTMSDRFSRVADQALDEVVPIGDVRVDLGPVAASGFQALIGVGDEDAFRAEVRKVDAQLRALIDASRVPAERDALIAAYQRWHGSVRRFDAMLSADTPASPEESSALAESLQQVDDRLAAAQEAAVKVVRAEAAEMRGLERRSTWSHVVVTVLACLAGIGVAIALSRSVLRPLRRLRVGVGRITKGNLSEPIALQRSDELGELADAIDAMAADLRDAQHELRHLALHDALTGLPNRTLLLDRAEQAVHRLARRRGGVAALMLVDLDDFKMVNDTRGHQSGDALLRTIAGRLRAELRDTDTAARIGGDEFALLVEHLDDEKEAFAVGDRIRRALAEVCEVDGTEMRPLASIGIAVATDATATATELLRNADLAMYAAKEHGKNRCVLFEAAMHTDAIEREALERSLRAAVHREELTLHYQPTIDLETGRLTGMEALIRWEHPEHGMMSPAQFIPLAEETGIIVPLGRWVLRRACAQLVEWQRIDAERFGGLNINVNLSARQLERPGVVADVRHALEQTGLQPERLVLELTESMLAGGDELLVRLHELRALGVRIAVDDFGTGYSSLAYLRRFPIDVLKIDRSFVSGIVSRHTDATLASTIIELGRMLELTTVAEGIEDAEQLELLRSLGCRLGQGFHIAKPLPPEELIAFVERTAVFPMRERVAKPAEVVEGRVERLVPALLDSAADAITLIDATGRVQYASKATERLFGYGPDETIGMDVFEQVHPDDLAGVMDAFGTTVATPGVKLPLLLRLRAADGTWIPVEIVSNNLLEEPSVRGIVIAIRDRREPTIAAVDNVTGSITRER
jgi:diguanylate cyclase (GGDEF)-like protein/PAS domain S-box-containing protein